MAATPGSTAIDAPQHVLDLLERLHKLSLDQEEKLKAPDGPYKKLKEELRDNLEKAQAKRDEVMRKFLA